MLLQCSLGQEATLKKYLKFKGVVEACILCVCSPEIGLDSLIEML